ncbi:MFS general substrate transporter [Aureobasidium pullulans]|nr:MFS general substrate transporter [Aureobasidium pullulans]
MDSVKKQSIEQLEIAPDLRKKLLRKVDLRILPPLTVLFLLAFLDRTNIGNAKIQDMTAELKMGGHDYNIALFVFFIPVPSNVVLKKISPSLWLSCIMVLWGIATIGQGLVKSFEGLVAIRVLVGIFEAGLFPGCVYLISMYYQRYELQWRLSLFFSASILAGGFGGLLAYALAKMDGIGGYSGWRWIFIIEGLLTVIVGIIARFWVCDWPETANFLTEEERTMLTTRLQTDSGEAIMNRLDKAATKRIFSDWKIYTGVIIIPIFIVAAICSIASAYLTDRLRHRFGFCIFGLVVASVGYVILLAQEGLSVAVKYFALFLVVPGGYITQPIVLAWVQNCMSGHYKRSISAAMTVGFGNLGGIVASNVFFTEEAPLYKTGYGVGLGFLWICGAGCVALFLGVMWENRKRDRGERDWRLQGEDVDNLGDDHPSFRFAT